MLNFVQSTLFSPLYYLGLLRAKMPPPPRLEQIKKESSIPNDVHFCTNNTISSTTLISVHKDEEILQCASQWV